MRGYRPLGPGDYHPDDAEWVKRLQSKGIRLCGFLASPGRWRCIQPVMRGSERCYQHSPSRRPLIDRFSDEQLRYAAELLGRGATQAKVGEILGITASQVSKIKGSQRFPEIVYRDPREGFTANKKAPPVELTRVGIIKTERGWATLYG